jgi:hypothetical protein
VSDTPTNPEETADENEGDDQDIPPIGTEALEAGEIAEWQKAIDGSTP